MQEPVHVKAGSDMQRQFISNISKDTYKIPLQTKINIVYKEKFCRKEKNVYLCIAEEKSSPDAALAEGQKNFTPSAAQPAYGPIAQLVRAPDS